MLDLDQLFDRQAGAAGRRSTHGKRNGERKQNQASHDRILSPSPPLAKFPAGNCSRKPCVRTKRPNADRRRPAFRNSRIRTGRRNATSGLDYSPCSARWSRSCRTASSTAARSCSRRSTSKSVGFSSFSNSVKELRRRASANPYFALRSSHLRHGIFLYRQEIPCRIGPTADFVSLASMRPAPELPGGSIASVSPVRAEGSARLRTCIVFRNWFRPDPCKNAGPGHIFAEAASDAVHFLGASLYTSRSSGLSPKIKRTLYEFKRNLTTFTVFPPRPSFPRKKKPLWRRLSADSAITRQS